MKKFFEVGIRRKCTMPNGASRKVTEYYLVDAVSFTEAERRSMEEVAPYSDGDVDVVSERIANIAEVVLSSDPEADSFYRIRHVLIVIDENKGTEKCQPQYIVVQAKSVDDARCRYADYMKGCLSDAVLESVSETKYSDYFRLEGK